MILQCLCVKIALVEKGNSLPDLFCTTGDYMRIWKVAEDGNSAKMECLLNNVRIKEDKEREERECVCMRARTG